MNIRYHRPDPAALSEDALFDGLFRDMGVDGVYARTAASEAGVLYDVACDWFRPAPSRNIDRFQSFRMREYVCIGSAEQVTAFRERWLTRAQGLADDLALTYRVDFASDPFFGRAGQMKG